MKNSSGSQTLESMSQAVWYNQWTVKKFEKYLHGEILEIGCGIGNFTKSLEKYGNIFAMDVSNNYVEQTKKIVKKKDNVGWGDIEKGKYFFKNKKFNCIVCINVLEHIKDDQRALRNMYELLNRGGYLVLLVPAFSFLYGDIDKSIGHFRRYNRGKLRKMLNEIGYKIIKSRVINFLGGLGWWISAKILSDSKIDERKIKIFNFIAPFILPFEEMIEPPVGTSVLIIAKK